MTTNKRSILCAKCMYVPCSYVQLYTYILLLFVRSFVRFFPSTFVVLHHSVVCVCDTARDWREYKRYKCFPLFIHTFVARTDHA